MDGRVRQIVATTPPFGYVRHLSPTRRHLWHGLAGAGVVLIGAAGGAALGAAAEQADDRVMRGCVDKRSGALRMPAAGRRCRANERRLVWRTRGRGGAAGTQGLSGPGGGSGAPGAAGAVGAAGEPGAPGPRGARGTFSLDDFQGMTCARPGGDGTVDLAYDGRGYAEMSC